MLLLLLGSNPRVQLRFPHVLTTPIHPTPNAEALSNPPSSERADQFESLGSDLHSYDLTSPFFLTDTHLASPLRRIRLSAHAEDAEQ